MLALMSSIDPLWVLISTHQHLLALVSIIEYGAMASSVLMRNNKCPWSHGPRSWLFLSSQECSLLHGAKLMSVHGCSWVLMAAHECSWLLLASYECKWVLTGAQECSWLYMSTHEQPWTLMSSAPWSDEHTWELKRSHELGAMGPWALISTHEHLWRHSTILMSSNECS